MQLVIVINFQMLSNFISLSVTFSQLANLRVLYENVRRMILAFMSFYPPLYAFLLPSNDLAKEVSYAMEMLL